MTIIVTCAVTFMEYVILQCSAFFSLRVIAFENDWLTETFIFHSKMRSLWSVVQLRWELGSPVFGLILRKYAPSDTYQVSNHKKGLLLQAVLLDFLVLSPSVPRRVRSLEDFHPARICGWCRSSSRI